MKSSTLKKVFINFMVSLIVLVVIGSCATVEKKEPIRKEVAEKKTPPEWIYNPPLSDDTYMYFTGIGSSKTNDVSEAESTARAVIISEILKYIGVEVTSNTTAVAKGSLDSFKSSITEKLTSKSSGRITSLEISDRWVERRDGGTTVYLLARYNRKELEEEKERLQKLFREKIEAISKPEAEGKRLASEGRYFSAAIKFIEASAAAATSDVDNARIKFERNINNAKSALANISLVKLTDNIKGYMGKPLKEAFKVKVVSGSDANAKGIANVAIQVNYYLLSKSGRKQVKSETIKTNEEGVAVFNHPIPNFVGKSSVIMSLDLSSYLEQLENIPKELSDYVDGLEELAFKKRVVFSMEIISYARIVPMGVVVADTDASGKPIEQNETENGMLEVFGKAEFNIRDVEIDKWSVTALPDRKLIPLFREKTRGQNIERVVFGYAKISGYEQDKDVTIVKVRGTVKVIELKSGKILLTVTKSKSAIGTKVSTALSTAFKKLGEDLAREIVNKLQ